ncbi:hypothetical protein ACFL6N_04820 [Thermodesulfobacteriota bacterium]
MHPQADPALGQLGTAFSALSDDFFAPQLSLDLHDLPFLGVLEYPSEYQPPPFS